MLVVRKSQQEIKMKQSRKDNGQLINSNQSLLNASNNVNASDNLAEEDRKQLDNGNEDFRFSSKEMGQSAGSGESCGRNRDE